MKKGFFSLFIFAMLHSCMGCSDSVEDNNTEGEQSFNVASEMVIYEANPRIFADKNAFKAIENHLDEIKELGTSVLWLMPVNEPGVEKSVGSPYCIKNYKALNSRYGNKDALKSLVETAHANGIKVILDWVANHTAWDHAWITDHPDWYTQDAEGNIVQPQEQPWADVADLNYENTEMQNAMIDAMKYWVTEIGIDGYRCDYAEGVPDAFWSKAISELRSINKELIMLAEGGKASLMNNGFDLLYGWNFQSKLKDCYTGACSVAELFAENQLELQDMPQGTYRLRYSTNHDQASESSPLQCYGGERGSMSAFVIATMLEGIPLIYSSQEVAYPEKLNFFDYKVINLAENKPYRNEIAAVIAAYKATKQSRVGNLTTYSMNKVVSFIRETDQHKLWVAVNTSNEEVQIKVPMECAGLVMTNMMSSEDLKLPTAMTLAPYQYVIYQK